MAVLLGSLVSKAPTRNLSLSRTEVRGGFGESGTTPHAIVATRMEGKPSRRNSSRHEAMGKLSPTHRISQARKPAKADASGAARPTSDYT